MKDGDGWRAADSLAATLLLPPSKLPQRQQGAQTSEGEKEGIRRKLPRKFFLSSVVSSNGKFGLVRRRAGGREALWELIMIALPVLSSRGAGTTGRAACVDPTTKAGMEEVAWR